MSLLPSRGLPVPKLLNARHGARALLKRWRLQKQQCTSAHHSADEPDTSHSGRKRHPRHGPQPERSEEGSRRGDMVWQEQRRGCRARLAGRDPESRRRCLHSGMAAPTNPPAGGQNAWLIQPISTRPMAFSSSTQPGDRKSPFFRSATNARPEALKTTRRLKIKPRRRTSSLSCSLRV